MNEISKETFFWVGREECTGFNSNDCGELYATHIGLNSFTLWMNINPEFEMNKPCIYCLLPLHYFALYFDKTSFSTQSSYFLNPTYLNLEML